MKAIAKKWLPASGIDTPYKRARQEWDDRMGGALVHARNWRLAAFCTVIFVAFPSITGLIYLGMQPKAVPHIIEVFDDGSAVYSGPVGRSWENYTPKKTSIIYHLHRFIEDTRTVSSDSAVIKRNWLDAYKLVTPNAANTLNTYANENDPFGRAREARVSVEITSTVSISGDSWQVDWTESNWGPKGNFMGETLWRGVFRIELVKPDKEADLVKNPLGLFIDEFNWTKINR